MPYIDTILEKNKTGRADRNEIVRSNMRCMLNYKVATARYKGPIGHRPFQVVCMILM